VGDGKKMKTGRNTKVRRTAILAHLKQHGRAMVDDLADLFETTPQTIRKDLTALADGGLVMRFHGGAALLAGTEYVGFDVRKEIAQEEKERIGRATAKQIPNNVVIMINAGTTTAAVARNLLHHVGLKVVTDSVAVANEIRGFAGVEVYVPGGLVRGSDGAILGADAVDFMRQFRVDLAVIGTAAIASDGALLDYDLREAQVARTIVENARNVILAADSTKFGRLAPVSIGHLSQMRTLVTDKDSPADLRELCKAHNVGLTEAR
jgi:DeoR family glycerol-3-phosphate regulon repressor